MKIDARVEIYGIYGNIIKEFVPVDLDYVEDVEDVISWVEEVICAIFDDDGLRYSQDFRILNLDEIEEELCRNFS